VAAVAAHATGASSATWPVALAAASLAAVAPVAGPLHSKRPQ